MSIAAPPEPFGIDVLIVEDVGWQREKIIEELSPHPDIRVVVEAGDIDSLVTKARQVPATPGRVRVAVIDIRVHRSPAPDAEGTRKPPRTENGLDAPRLLRRQVPETRCLAFTEEVEGNIVRRAFRDEGFDGYLVKGTGKGLLGRAIREVALHGRHIDPRIAEHLIRSPEQAALGDRHYHVLTLLARGEKLKSIADEVHLSEKRVGDIFKEAREGLDVRTNTEAVVRAMQKGLINP